MISLLRSFECGGIRLSWRLLLALGLPLSPASAEDSLSSLAPFLERHCYECHGEDVQKNDYRFDTLGPDLSNRDTLRAWQDILDQLNLGEMPPAKKPQPEASELTAVVETLSAALREAYARHRGTGGKAVLRRLNRIELRNTLRDLLYLEGPVFRNLGMAKLEDSNGNGSVSRNSVDPIRDFPGDELEEGFDTIGGRLVMSDFLLNLVLGAAEECLALATHPAEKPVVETRRFSGHIRTDGPGGLESQSREFNRDFDAIYQRYREPGASSNGLGRVAPSRIVGSGVGTAARYRVTVEASAHNQRHPWGELIKSRQEEPMLLGLHTINGRRGGLNDGNPETEMLAEWPMIADGEVRTFSVETWLDATWLPWIGWENAPYDRALGAAALVEKYLPAAFRPKPGNEAPKEERESYETEMARALFEGGYQGPHLRIHSLTVEPLLEIWPPESDVFLYGATSVTPVAELLSGFARRAFRRPVAMEEVARYVKLAETERASGRSRVEALQTAYTAIIASPRFYYLQESDTGGHLDDFEIASRLSYFLWSSMPDEELFALASAGTLHDPAVLDGQVERMLGHRNAAAFVRRFTERWLRLDKLGLMPPENGGPFRIYWDRQMESQMLRQTDAYFAHVLATNGPIRDFIQSDDTFLNERVASLLYGRDDVWGDGFRKVRVDDPRRGGILTTPAVMTATANGVDTSPVVRGVWLLENILGKPPSPPPPDVQPLAPDLRGAQTIREQLERHREDVSCNNCHRKIDPMGFPFENFNPIGVWRDTYPDSRRAIDSATVLPDGRAVADIVALKQALLGREHDITRCLTEKLLAYASGRILEPGDRGEVDRILGVLRTENGGLRDLVKLVAGSDIFLTK